MKIIKKIVILALFMIFAAMPSFATVKISPEKFEFTTTAGQKFINGFFTINLTGNEPVRYRVYTEFFDISENGTLVSAKNTNAANSIVNNIRFNPKEITVSPNTPQTIRFTIVNPTSLPDGESRAVLFLEDTKTKTQTLFSQDKSVAASINLKTRIGIPIYVDNGKISKNAELTDFLIKKDGENYLCQANLKSIGNSKVRAGGKIQVIKDKELVEEILITGKPVQGNTTGRFSGIIPSEKLIPGQEYKIKLNISYKDEKQNAKYLTKEINFTPESKQNL